MQYNEQPPCRYQRHRGCVSIIFLLTLRRHSLPVKTSNILSHSAPTTLVADTACDEYIPVAFTTVLATCSVQTLLLHYAEVMRENAYLSRTVEVQEGQTVIDTGLYGVVRNPMYFATVLLFLAMPLVLGSLCAFLLMLAGYFPIIAWRIRDEEKTLAEGLPGYRDYMAKVKYRLFPLIW